MLKSIIAIFSVFLSAIAHCDDRVGMSSEEVLGLWKRSNSESVEIQNVFTAYSMDKEKVYLANAYFPKRGINATGGVLLVRPKFKEIKDISEYWVGIDSVMDMNNDGVSEIYSIRSGLGQGEFSESNAIFQIDNWKLVKIMESVSENTEGAYGRESSQYHSKMYKWSFRDINHDGTLDIYEVENDEDGVEGEEPIKSEKSREYIFNGVSFYQVNK